MNYKIGLFITYLVYLFTVLGMIYAFLAPKVAHAWFWREVEAKVIVEELDIEYNYELNDKVPEFVIDDIISRHATGTKAYSMKRTLYCESHYYNVQSNIIKNGHREDSWGIAQINLYWNNSVKREQALDIEFAIKWMSDNWETTVWYGWNKELDLCN